MTQEFQFQNTSRWVVKVGSSLITSLESGINIDRLRSWARQIASLKKQGVEIVLVSSGSVVEGMKRLGWKESPYEVHLQQVAAAVGQMGLVRTYETAFEEFGYLTAQVLLTDADLADRTRYLNARNALRTMLEMGIIPVVNENDTVTTDEIKLGDNDNLAGLVTNIIDAELLVILTDQAGIFDEDPRTNSNANLIEHAYTDDTRLMEVAGPGGEYGRGGMRTKIEAACRAARSGAATVIASGLEDNQLQKIRENEFVGTLLTSRTRRMTAHKQWLAGRLRASGTLHLDLGAVSALMHQGRSLLPVGVKQVEGDFQRGDLVVCVNPEGHEVARGLINYNAVESHCIKGSRSDRIENLLGYIRDQELIHRDNMVLM